MGRDDSLIDLVNSKNIEYEKYWHSLPRTGIVPDKCDFLPENVLELLPTFVMYELVTDDFIKNRLLGSLVDGRYGFGKVGKNYLDFVAPERRVKASRSLWNMAKQPCGMKVIVKETLHSGRHIFEETIGFPLNDIQNDCHILLFQINQIDKRKEESDPKDILTRIEVVQRDYIDIGAGVPKSTR